MPVDHTQQAQTSEVLRDLARLAVRAVTEPFQPVAHDLLVRVTSLLGASAAELSLVDGTESAGAEQRLATYHTDGVAVPAAARALVWHTYSLALPVQAAISSDGALPDDGSQPRAAALRLGWSGESSAIRAEQTEAALAQLEDSIAVVLIQGLAAERIRTQDAEVARLRRQAIEARPATVAWEQAFDAISDPICIVSADYQLVQANAAYRRLFGAERARRGPHVCYVGVSGGNGPCEGCPLPTSVRTGQPAVVRQEQFLPTGPGGAMERRVFQRWTYPVTDDSGAVTYVVELVKDVTEQERLAELASRAEALREADRLKAELLGSVSHELRSPLTMIKGYAATLLRHERRLPREERHEYLSAINDACDRLSQIIGRLLEMSQLEIGSVQLDRRRVDVMSLVAGAVDSAQAAADKEGQPVNIAWRVTGEDGGTAPADLPAVLGDPRRLRDVLDNLLENARKYSPSGGSIEVAVRPVSRATMSVAASGQVEAGAGGKLAPASGEYVEICVRDSGLGIPQEQLDLIFDRFHRVDTRLTREVAGMGLGLALCRRIIELHHGTIWAESEPGAGSAFFVLLPAVGEDA
jgi:signal transduction histidine kinase